MFRELFSTVNDQRTWPELLPEMKLAIKSAISTSTWVSPYYAMFRKHPRIELDMLTGHVAEFAPDIVNMQDYVKTVANSLKNCYRYIRTN